MPGLNFMTNQKDELNDHNKGRKSTRLPTETQHWWLNVINESLLLHKMYKITSKWTALAPPSPKIPLVPPPITTTTHHPEPPPAARSFATMELSSLKPMTTASPMVGAKRMVTLRDNTYPISASLNN